MYHTSQQLYLNLLFQCFCLRIKYTFGSLLTSWTYLSLCETILLYIFSEYHFTYMDIMLDLDVYYATFLHNSILIVSFCSGNEAIIVCVYREEDILA